MQPIHQAIAAERYEKALKLATSAGHIPDVRNAKGVCLLRLGRFEEAVAVYRELVVNPGTTSMRPGVPTVYKTNFATALLLAGNVSGCQQTLDEMAEEQHPTVQRLRTAIQRWQKSLSLWQKINWRVGGIEPGNRPATIDFTPGELVSESGLTG